MMVCYPKNYSYCLNKLLYLDIPDRIFIASNECEPFHNIPLP